MRHLVSLSPWAEFERMWNAMDRMAPIGDTEFGGMTVPMDIYEEGGKLMVRCSVPGVKPEDLNSTIDQGVLTLSGECKNEHESKEGNRVFHREHAYGRFTRSVRLPEDIDENQVGATFENGIITVAIGRSTKPEIKPKQIQIKQSSTASTKAIGPGTSDVGQSSNKTTEQSKIVS